MASCFTTPLIKNFKLLFLNDVLKTQNGDFRGRIQKLDTTVHASGDKTKKMKNKQIATSEHENSKIWQLLEKKKEVVCAGMDDSLKSARWANEQTWHRCEELNNKWGLREQQPKKIQHLSLQKY